MLIGIPMWLKTPENCPRSTIIQAILDANNLQIKMISITAEYL